MAETQNNQKDAAGKDKRSEKRSRTQFIRARVTPEEKMKFDKRCHDRGFTAGDYIRYSCIDAKPLGRAPKRSVNEKAMSEILLEVGKMGKGLSNINQLARALNTALLTPDVSGTELVKVVEYHQKNLEAMYETISELRANMREMLLKP